MANLLWGKVYFNDVFSGILREEPGGGVSFAYDESYLDLNLSPVAHTLPLQEDLYISHAGLHPFFDNLVAEGWLESAQTRLLGKRTASRFELLLTFGQDCAGGVSVTDPESTGLSEKMIDKTDQKEIALLTNRASLSGVQPKLTLIEKNGKLIPTRVGELSTHIAKFPSPEHPDLIINEYLTTKAFQALLPDDDVVPMEIREVDGFSEPALVVKRFDRLDGKRIHFEEFNQLLNKKSTNKYEGSYKDMADFIQVTTTCLPVEVYRLFGRVLAGFLLGNTDMHLKNFAMFHTTSGLRLTPSYDQVSAVLYGYRTVALSIGGANDLRIGDLKPKNIKKLSEEFSLSESALTMMINHLSRRKEIAKQLLLEEKIGSLFFKNQLIQFMEARWNGTFA